MAFGRTPNSIQSSFARAAKSKAPAVASPGGQGFGGNLGAAFAALHPAAPAPTPPPAPAPTPPADPRDSIYTGGVNGLLYNNKNQRDDLTHQGEQATQDFNTMLARMAESRANDLLSTNHAANQQGLFYSGQLGKRRDDVEKGYKQQEDDQRTAYTRAGDVRQTALDRLGTIIADPNSPLGYTATGQAGIDLSALYGQAVGRQTGADAGGGGDLAAATALGPNLAASAYVPAAITSAVDPTPTVTDSGPQGGGVAIKIAPSAAHGGAKWVYHRAASGQWIPVRPAS